MTDSLIQIQVFYELAMSIGNSLDLKRVMRESLAAYLRKLNCSAGVILCWENIDDHSQRYMPLFSIPRNAMKLEACRAGLENIPPLLTPRNQDDFFGKLPIFGTWGERQSFHLMNLPDFGLLLLVKSGECFHPFVLKSLEALNQKLADSCIACLQSREIEKINRRLVHEIEERRRAESELKEVLNGLENRVADRTSKLWSANEKLRREIRERKRTEKALRESEQRYKAIFDNIQDVFFCVSLDGSITEISPSMEKISGFTRKDLLAKNIDVFFNDRQGSKPLISSIIQTGLITNHVLEFADKSETVKTCSMNATVIRDEFGNAEKIVGSLRDITQQKKAEIEKRELEKKLARSKKMEALGLLAGGVAHDLNNVLSGVVSYPDLLLRLLPPDSKLVGPVRVIRESGKKAAAIVQDLLTLARRGVLQKEVVNLNEIISSYLNSPEFSKLKSYHPDIMIHAEQDPELLNIEGSAFHLRKVVMNLVSNAVESGASAVIISTFNRYADRTVKGYQDIEQGEYAVLKVEDNGVGISSKDVSRIFEPFYTKKIMGRSGTGLGMSVVWGSVQDHGGQIDVQSEEGRGSAFTLFFPVTRKKTSEAPKAISVNTYKGKGERVLVVDDVKTQREIAQVLLEELDYRVETAESGEKALDFLKNHKVDIVLLDMIMEPGLDGLDTYRRILRINPSQKALIASGFSETHRVKETLKLGACTYIRKPYSMEQIGMAIRGCLDRED